MKNSITFCRLDSIKAREYILKVLQKNDNDRTELWINHVIGQGNSDLKQGLTPIFPFNDISLCYPSDCLIFTTHHIHTLECGDDCLIS